MATKNDDKIKGLLSKVEEQQKGLGVKPRAQWQTNGIFKYKDGTFFNLNTVREAAPLIEALSYLLGNEATRAEAAKRLGLVPALHVHDSYPISDWEKDFRLRLDIVAYEGRKAQLEETQKKLKALRSEDAKTEDALSDIENLLK